MRRLIKLIAITSASLILLFLMLLRPIHSTADAHLRLLQALDTLTFKKPISQIVHVAWAKFNITPSLPVNMAGYGKREAKSVHDSLYIRLLLFQTAKTHQRFILLAVDLLIFPPALYKLLLENLAKIGIPPNHVYVTATHTHSSLGGWMPSLLGQFYIGKYQDTFWKQIVKQLIETIQNQGANASPAKIAYTEVDGRRWVKNRLNSLNPVDAKVRVLKIVRADKKAACLINFSAHATLISPTVLSADYPGVLVQTLEADPKVDFAIFTAGTVGSHAVAHKALQNFDLAKTIGESISYKILKQFDNLDLESLDQLNAARFELPLSKPQLRISSKWMIAPWLFEQILGKVNAHLSFLKLNEIIFLGLPCDFSGEIAVRRKFYSALEASDQHLIISSFNGAYIGYITPDQYYHTVNHAEVREMNWFGAGGERYFSTLIEHILAKQK